jgi:threonine/homoserine/homoserine lactone efflux protein
MNTLSSPEKKEIDMEFALIAGAHFLALLSPGPDFFLIMQASLRLPRRYGITICTGIASANAVYLLLAVLGLEIIKDTDWLVGLLRYLGAAYLIFIGICLLRAPRADLDSLPTSTFLGAHHMGRQFLVGFLSGILNPKNAIFYLSLFTVMVSVQTGLGTRFLYALWMASVVFLWDSGIVMVIGRKAFRTRLGRSIFFLEKISGAMLALFGILLPFS